MTLKQFNAVRMVAAVVVAAVVGQAIVLNNYLLAVAAVLIAVAVMLMFKRRVSEVIEDERDRAVAGKAALMTMKMFAIAASVATFALLALRQKDPAYEAAGSVLAYATCALLLIHSFIYQYMIKRPSDRP